MTDIESHKIYFPDPSVLVIPGDLTIRDETADLRKYVEMRVSGKLRIINAKVHFPKYVAVCDGIEFERTTILTPFKMCTNFNQLET